MKLAEARSSFSAAEYASRLQMLGLPQGAIFLLEQGPNAVKALVDEQERHAKITKQDVDASKAFQKAMVDLSNTIEGQVRPFLTSIVKAFDEFAEKIEHAKAQLPELNDMLLGIGAIAVAVGAPFVALAAAIGLVIHNLDYLKEKWSEFSAWWENVEKSTDTIMDPLRKALGLKTGAEARKDRTDVFGRPIGGAAASPHGGAGTAPRMSTDDFLRANGITIEHASPDSRLRDQAEEAIENIGGRITSRTRTYAEQAKLYAAYRAYQEGRGPWAPLAAKPGTSAHETGRALDIGYGPGISLGSIAAALLGHHIPFHDLRNEGNHYHVALGALHAATVARRAQLSGPSTTTIGDIHNYYGPAERAAINLTLTPAPDLDAALFRIEVMKAYELNNTTDMPRGAFEIVAEEMARLAPVVVPASADSPIVDPVEAAFAEWKSMLVAVNEQGKGGDEFEGPEYAGLDAAEMMVMEAIASKPRVAEMRLWMALQYTLTDQAECRAIAREDIGYLLSTNGPRDWRDKFLVNAIAALKGRQPSASATGDCETRGFQVERVGAAVPIKES